MNVLKLKGKREDYDKVKRVLSNFGLSYFHETPDSPLYVEDIGYSVMKHLLKAHEVKCKVKSKSITLYYNQEEGLRILDYDEIFQRPMKGPIKTLGDLIRNKDYDYIEVREATTQGDLLVSRSFEEVLLEYSEFKATCASKDGRICSLDQSLEEDISVDTPLITYIEWGDHDQGIKNGLTIIKELHLEKQMDDPEEESR